MSGLPAHTEFVHLSLNLQVAEHANMEKTGNELKDKCPEGLYMAISNSLKLAADCYEK